MAGLSREEIAQLLNDDYLTDIYEPRVNAINAVEARDNAIDEAKNAAIRYYQMNDPRGNGVPIEELHPEVARSTPQRIMDTLDLIGLPALGYGLAKAATSIPGIVLSRRKTEPFRYLFDKYGGAIGGAGYLLGKEQIEDAATQDALNYALSK